MEIGFWPRSLGRFSSTSILHRFSGPGVGNSVGLGPNQCNFYSFNCSHFLQRKGGRVALERCHYRIWRRSLDHAARLQHVYLDSSFTHRCSLLLCRFYGDTSKFRCFYFKCNNLFVFLRSCCAWSDPFGDWNH